MISLSIKEKNALKVYPNPTTDVLTVEFQISPTLNPTTFEVINLLGQMILRGTLNQSVDVSRLPSGAYFVKVGGEQVKFVKQ